MNRKHGHTSRTHRPAVYMVWSAMLARCSNQNHPSYKDYGGRGISVCDRWKSFEAFMADMGHPAAGETLERIDNNGNYESSNCQWTSRKAQARNRRSNHIVVLCGEPMTLADAVDRSNVKYNTVLYRLRRGWSIEDAISREIGQ